MVALIGKFLDIVRALLEADGDDAKVEAALMDAQESIKAELDRRKFGGATTEPAGGS
jgi:hypothetical protein